MKIFLSLIVVCFASKAFSEVEALDEVVIIEEAVSNLSVSYPFMSCAVEEPQADFINVTLIVNADDPTTGSVTTMRNPEFDDLYIDDFEADGAEDLEDFNFSPIAVMSNDLKITPQEEEGLYQIAGGFAGFTTVEPQIINGNKTRAALTLSSVLDDQKINLKCSVYPFLLDRVFNQSN
jgi:hypothetical protein